MLKHVHGLSVRAKDHIKLSRYIKLSNREQAFWNSGN